MPGGRGNHGDLSEVAPGIVDPRAGRAAFEFLAAAAGLALAGRIDAITTLPLNKLALHQAASATPVTPRSWPNTAAWPTTR